MTPASGATRNEGEMFASGASRPPRFDVEEYIANAPRRTPRFTEADLRLVSDRAYERGWEEGRAAYAEYLLRLADGVRDAQCR